jgi:CRP-like cAMP-binding protein
MPIIEDLSLEEKVRHANTFLKSRPRDLEDTLAQLVHDDDQVVAASAIHFVEQRRLWSLAHDLEYSVAHRTPHDFAFEAATWALARHQLSDSRRGPSTESLPIVALADRLRAIPVFDFVSVDELFRIAGAGRQSTYEPGREIGREGTPATDVQFLLEGDVQLSAAGDAPREVAAPIALAFEEVLEGAPLGCTARAVDRAVTLALDGSDFLTMLSDNVVLAQGLFRVLLDRPKMQPWRVVYAPQAGAAIPRGPSPQPIEIVLLLRQNPLLRRATVGQLLDLVAITREVELTAGRVLFAETDGPAVYHILAGEVSLEGDRAEERIVGSGCTIGLAETLAGVPLGRRSTVTHSGRALRIERDDLFDVLTDHVDLLQGLFSGVLSAGEPEAAVAEAPRTAVSGAR